MLQIRQFQPLGDDELICQGVSAPYVAPRWPTELENAKQALLTDLDEIRVDVPLVSDLQPFPRSSMEPAVDGLIRMVMESTFSAIDAQIPKIQVTVRKGAAGVGGGVFLASVALGLAVGFLVAKAA